MSEPIFDKYKYRRDFDKDTPKLLEYLFNGGTDKEIIKKMCIDGLDLIDQRYDCSDFRIEIFTRIICGYDKVIGKEIEDLIMDSIFSFPFEDQSNHSMCTWTENHQLILNVSEYLLGNRYPNSYFHNNILGSDCAKKAFDRMNDWCNFIFKFGFSEFGSCNYYPETLGALGNIIEFCNDETLRNKFKIVLNLLLYDIFSKTLPNLSFNIATARAYVDNKINYYNYLLPHIKSLLGEEIKVNHEREACFFLMLRAKDNNGNKIYELPKVFIDILNTKERLIKDSNGLNHEEYKKYGIDAPLEKNVLYILTSGTGASYISYKNVMNYMIEKKMWNNAMYKDLLQYRSVIYTAPSLFRFMMRNNYINGFYGRGNTYTYINGNYSVSSLRRYQINKPLFQQVSHMINLDGLSVFTTAPALSKDKMGSPSYWVGSKIAPDCLQNKNVLIVYYKKKPKITHIYFPVEQFDEINLDHINEGYIFGNYHGINIMIKTNKELEFDLDPNDNSIIKDEKITNFKLKKYDILNKNSNYHYYIFEVDNNLNFNDFIKNSLSNKIAVKKDHISYKDLNYNYNKKCFYKNEEIDFTPIRYESKFIKDGIYNSTKKRPLTIVTKNHSLTLDFINSKIEEN